MTNKQKTLHEKHARLKEKNKTIKRKKEIKKAYHLVHHTRNISIPNFCQEEKGKIKMNLVNFLETLEVIIRWGLLELAHLVPLLVIYVLNLVIKANFGVNLIYIMFKKMGLN